MKKAELLKMIENDFKLTHDNVESMMYAVPGLYSKYLRLYFEFKTQLSKKQKQLAEKYKSTWIKYKEGDDLLDKKEIQFHILADEEYSQLHYETQVLEDLVDVLDRTVKKANSLSFDVKNLVEYLKYMQGV